mgnify:FL=1|nr:tripartite tricarboxylate transporter TctB family protein [Clostridium sp. OF09-10]
MAKGNKIAGVILLAVFGIALKMALGFPDRAMYFPVFVSGLGVFLSILLIINGFMTSKEAKEKEGLTLKGKKMVGIMLAAMIIYVVGMQYIGFCVATFIFLIATMIINFPGTASKKDMIKIVAVSLAVTVIIYVVFKKMLYVPLPQGFLI